jgi:hypothetical protein
MEHAERYPCQWRRTNEITLEDEYADSRVIALGQWINGGNFLRQPSRTLDAAAYFILHI